MTIRTLIIYFCMTLLYSNHALGNDVSSDTNTMNHTDICDLRQVFGTCHEYDLNRLNKDAIKYYRESCAKEMLDDKINKYYGKYIKNRRCPKQNRVGICKGYKFPDDEDGWAYDKHYYSGTSKHYPWKRGGFEGACNALGAEVSID